MLKTNVSKDRGQTMGTDKVKARISPLLALRNSGWKTCCPTRTLIVRAIPLGKIDANARTVAANFKLTNIIVVRIVNAGRMDGQK